MCCFLDLIDNLEDNKKLEPIEISQNYLTGDLSHLNSEYSGFEIRSGLPYQDREFGFNHGLLDLLLTRNELSYLEWTEQIRVQHVEEHFRFSSWLSFPYSNRYHRER
jgi:hypothetical protein